MWGWKRKFNDLELSKSRLEKYYNDLLATSEKREDELHRNYLQLSEQNTELTSQIIVLEHQVRFLSELIGKMRAIVGVEEITSPESPETPQEDCEDSSSSEA